MNQEEFKALLSSEEGKNLFTQTAKELGYESPEDVAGLRAKRDELLGINKNLKDKTRDLESKLSGIDFEEYQMLKEKGTGNKTTDDLMSLKRQLNVSETKHKESLDKISKLENAYFNKVKEAELNKIFNDINIDSRHSKLLTSAFKDKVKVDGDYDKLEIYIDVDGNGLGLPASEYFKKWAVSDEGKPYLKTPESRGTGSHQMSAKNVKTISRKDFDAIPVTERADLLKQGIKVEE